MEWILMTIIAMQLGYMVFREIQFQKQTGELLNRLMARDLHEYKQITNPEPVKEEPKPISPEGWNQMMSDMYDGKVG